MYCKLTIYIKKRAQLLREVVFQIGVRVMLCMFYRGRVGISN